MMGKIAKSNTTFGENKQNPPSENRRKIQEPLESMNIVWFTILASTLGQLIATF